jgi:hypothetical protein
VISAAESSAAPLGKKRIDRLAAFDKGDGRGGLGGAAFGAARKDNSLSRRTSAINQRNLEINSEQW